MYRSSGKEDCARLCQIWNQQMGLPAHQAEQILTQAAGLENVYLAQQDGEILAVLAVIPVSIQQMPGVYFYGAVELQQGALQGLAEYAKQQQLMHGKGFGVVAAGNGLDTFWQQQGFEPYFTLRRLRRSIRRNLWAQAQFDSITAARFAQLREKYCPQAVAVQQPAWVAQVMQMYSKGATTVETEHGYAVYFEKGETLEFVELFARSDYDAQFLMEAARERTGVEQAEITLPENSEICLGEGVREVCGMANFWAVQPPADGGYMRLMLD